MISPRLRPLDQIGLIADNWALGLAGYQSPAVALDMAAAAPGNANSKLWERVATVYAQIDAMYAGDEANRARFAPLCCRPAATRAGPARLEPARQRAGQ